jgi:hypothetical protein
MYTRAIPVILGCCIILMSCGGADNPDTDGTDDTGDTTGSVYPAKTYVVGQGTNDDPVVWHDTAVTSLSMGTGATSGVATGVVLVSGVVYICGYWSNGTNTYPCVWIDGTRTDLEISGTIMAGSTTAIAASGSAIYAAGDAWNDTTGYYLPGYWTFDGASWTWTEITATTNGGRASAIAIDASGMPWFSGYNTVGASIEACFWDASGIRCDLTELHAGSYAPEAFGVAVVGASATVIGTCIVTAFEKYPSYWTTTGRTEITNPAIPDSVNAITSSGTDIYIAGVCTTSLYPIPGYWKNGTWNALSVGDHFWNNATAIVVSDSIVYVAGQYTNDGLATLGCFWAGGERIDVEGVLPVYGIAVVE